MGKYSCKAHFRSFSKSLFFLEKPEVEYLITNKQKGSFMN